MLLEYLYQTYLFCCLTESRGHYLFITSLLVMVFTVEY
jgi:hypothetical protein